MNNDQNPQWGHNPNGPSGPWPNQGGQPQNNQRQPPQGWNPQGQPPQGWNPQGQPPQGWNPPGQPPQGGGFPSHGAPVGWSAQAGPLTQESPKKKSRTPAIIAGALALALVAGGAVFAVNFLGGSTVAAAKGVPANALGIVEINLNPSVADKLAIKDFAEKFPEMLEGGEDVEGDYAGTLWESFFNETDMLTGDAPDFSEVEPWLGDSVAIAAMPGTSDMGDFEPEILATIQVTDEGKAKDFMAKHAEGTQIAFFEDLMLVTEEGSAAPDTSGLDESSLADNSDYQADMAKLGGSWLVTGWLSSNLLQEMIDANGDGTGIDMPVQDTHGAMGMKVEDGAAVIHTVSWSETPLSAASAASFVNSLPAGNLLAMGFTLDDTAYDALWEQLEPLMTDPSTAEIFNGFGVQTKEDLKALLGSEMAMSMSLDSEGMPRIGLKVRTDDTARHQEFLDLLAMQGGLGELEHVVDGDVITTTFGMSASEFSTPTSMLGDDENFAKLTATTNDPQVLMYVDVAAAYSLFEDLGMGGDELAGSMGRLSGFGMAVSPLDGNYSETVMRLGTK